MGEGSPVSSPARGTLKSVPVPSSESGPLSVESWSIIGTTIGTGVVLLIALGGLILTLWGDFNRRLEHLEIGLRSEIRAWRDEIRRKHVNANAVTARLDVLLLARGSLVDPPAAAPASGERQPATAAEPAPGYRVAPRGAGGSDRP